MNNSEQELQWIIQLLDQHRVPDESMEAQAGGATHWTTAGRVEHLLRLLKDHDIDVDEGVRAVPPPAKSRS